jgi:hypothetical protein
MLIQLMYKTIFILLLEALEYGPFPMSCTLNVEVQLKNGSQQNPTVLFSTSVTIFYDHE